MTKEKIESKKEYIRNQLENKNGIYSILLVRSFYYILDCCRKNQADWCYSYNATDYVVARFAYAAVRDGRMDHMGRDIIGRIKKTLIDMGYLAFKKVDDKWRIYVIKELDFLDKPIEEYVK